MDTNKYLLSSNSLKIVAAFFMLIDHVGILFFPNISIFRILGRIAFPIFAFMIAEGCRYTKNKLKYFLNIALLGVACQIVYFIYDGELYMCILITFSLSIVIIYALQRFKELVFSKTATKSQTLIALGIVIVSVVGTYYLNKYIEIDYGFLGCMTPVFASLLHSPKGDDKIFSKIDNVPMCVGVMTIALILLAHEIGGVQIYSLLALPFLLLYSKKRGKYKMKYFFYIFYPLHLIVLQGIYCLLYYYR